MYQGRLTFSTKKIKASPSLRTSTPFKKVSPSKCHTPPSSRKQLFDNCDHDINVINNLIDKFSVLDISDCQDNSGLNAFRYSGTLTSSDVPSNRESSNVVEEFEKLIPWVLNELEKAGKVHLMGQAQSAKLDGKIVRDSIDKPDGVTSQPSLHFPLADFPDDILEEISLRLPASDLVGSCMYVCKRWRDVINSQTLWKEKCKRDYCYTNEMFLDTEDFKQLYFKNPYNSNLVTNPCAEEGFRHWNVTKNGGNHFIQESVPIGCHPVKNFAKCDTIVGPVGCWVTSYRECRKEQEIDLLNRGCSPKILDNMRPDINVSERYAARFDCGCEYRIKIKLLDGDRKVLACYEFKDNKGPGGDWFQFTHVFTSYPPGCRFIKYSHGGKDDRFWAGHYGVKITLSSLKFDFSRVAGPYAGKFQLQEQNMFESSSESDDSDDIDEWSD